MLNELQLLNLINLLTLYFMNTQKQVNWVTNKDLNTASQQKRKHRKTANIWFKLFSQQNIFGKDSSQNYLVFQPVLVYLKASATVNKCISLDWKSKWTVKRKPCSILEN